MGPVLKLWDRHCGLQVLQDEPQGFWGIPTVWSNPANDKSRYKEISRSNFIGFPMGIVGFLHRVFRKAELLLGWLPAVATITFIISACGPYPAPHRWISSSQSDNLHLKSQEWFSHDFPWFSHDFPIKSIKQEWFSYDFPISSHFPTGFPCPPQYTEQRLGLRLVGRCGLCRNLLQGGCLSKTDQKRTVANYMR